jgi:hypothetical protein
MMSRWLGLYSWIGWNVQYACWLCKIRKGRDWAF